MHDISRIIIKRKNSIEFPNQYGGEWNNILNYFKNNKKGQKRNIGQPGQTAQNKSNCNRKT